MQDIDRKVLSKIIQHGRGWAFTKTDHLRELSQKEIHPALSNLTKMGKIRRVCHGVYDYPKYDKVRKVQLDPDMYEVAQAFARKFTWRIHPYGELALEAFGFPTQPIKPWIFVSDGPNREYQVGDQTLVFKQEALKDSGFSKESGQLIQVIKALGRHNITEADIEHIRKKIKPKLRKRIIKETHCTTAWVYKYVKEICRAVD